MTCDPALSVIPPGPGDLPSLPIGEPVVTPADRDALADTLEHVAVGLHALPAESTPLACPVAVEISDGLHALADLVRALPLGGLAYPEHAVPVALYMSTPDGVHTVARALGMACDVQVDGDRACLHMGVGPVRDPDAPTATTRYPVELRIESYGTGGAS